MLSALRARKRLGDQRELQNEPGEKCTLCGARQALTNHQGGGRAETQRQAARALWARLDPEGLGAERLCGPCAVRRYLSDSADPIQRNWQGTVHPSERGHGSRHAVPFPSTGLVAGQAWVVKLCDAYPRDVQLQRAVRDFNRAFGQVGVGRTQFAGALPQIRRLLQGDLPAPLRELLEIDLQYVDPAAWERLEAAGKQAPACRGAAEASRRLLQRVGSSPPTHLAVITLDGDRMGELLVGTPARVGARWRDVLHPDAIEAIQKDPLKKETPPWKRAWRSTLESERLMGPSLHAFISRALRHFSNRVLPWVVEREFHGRLIYVGGDDALLLCPAADALPLLLRLDALFTASWVLDHNPADSTWVTEEPQHAWFVVGSDAAKERFHLIENNKGLTTSSGGRIFPMLGPHSHFSAGVAIGHFKTSLRRLRAEAATQLNLAKQQGGRRAGVTWFTRAGPKVGAVLPLVEPQPGSVAQVHDLACDFWEGDIPGRLPYKLREAEAIARQACRLDDGRAQVLLEGLVGRALEGDQERARSIAAAWLAELRSGSADGSGDPAFLLLARALSSTAPKPREAT